MDCIRLAISAGFVLLFCAISASASNQKSSEEDTVVRVPSKCEVCRVFAHELDEKMKATKTSMKIELGSKPSASDARKIDYSRSELRLLEIMDTVCSNVSAYYVHNKEGMQRYAKQESETLDALNTLRRRGVKVEIGMPWEVVENQPNKEIMALKRRCEALVEDHEDDLTAWFFQQQETPILDFFCRRKYLDEGETECLDQPWLPYGEPYTEEPAKEEKKEKDEL